MIWKIDCPSLSYFSGCKRNSQLHSWKPGFPNVDLHVSNFKSLRNFSPNFENQNKRISAFFQWRAWQDPVATWPSWKPFAIPARPGNWPAARVTSCSWAETNQTNDQTTLELQSLFWMLSYVNFVSLQKNVPFLKKACNIHVVYAFVGLAEAKIQALRRRTSRGFGVVFIKASFYFFWHPRGNYSCSSVQTNILLILVFSIQKSLPNLSNMKNWITRCTIKPFLLCVPNISLNMCFEVLFFPLFLMIRRGGDSQHCLWGTILPSHPADLYLGLEPTNMSCTFDDGWFGNSNILIYPSTIPNTYIMFYPNMCDVKW